MSVEATAKTDRAGRALAYVSHTEFGTDAAVKDDDGSLSHWRLSYNDLTYAFDVEVVAGPASSRLAVPDALFDAFVQEVLHVKAGRDEGRGAAALAALSPDQRESVAIAVGMGREERAT